MAKYAVKVEEIYSRTYVVEADSYEDAEYIINDAYREGNITLDYSDFDGDYNITQTSTYGQRELNNEEGRYYTVYER